MSAHTPGPWSLKSTAGARSLWRVLGASGRFIGTISRPFKGVDTADADARLISAAPDLLVACANARDMLATERQSFVDCHQLHDTRTDEAIAHGLVWASEGVWIAPEDAEPLRDYDRAIALIDAAIAKATGAAA